MSFERIKRHSVATRIGNSRNGDSDDCAASRLGWKESAQTIEFRIVRFEDFSSTIESHDARRPLKRTQHDDDAPVLSQMGDRLGTASDVIEIGEPVRIQYPETIQPLLATR
jgi:hypothetical protein